MREMRNSYNILVRKSEGEIPLGRLRCRDGRTMLELILDVLGGKVWIGFVWLRTGTSDGLL
jgi:hypothetical protein